MSRSLSGIGNNIYMLAAGSTTGGTGIKITGTTNSTSNTINLDITGLTTKTNINTTDYFLVEQSDEVLKKIKFSELTGIGNNDLVKVDSSFATDNDYVKFTTVGVEGRSYAEVKTDLSLNLVENTAISTFDGTGNNIIKLGTVSQGTWNATAITNAYIDTGIADNKIVEIDSSSVASTEYACFTSNGLESKNSTEMRTYLNISNVENTAISTFDGTGNNITKLGTITAGTWNATTIAMTKGGTGFTGIGKGEIYYGDASLNIAKLAVGTNGHYLTLSSGIPAWTDLISTTIRTSSSQPTIAIPVKTSGHTLACLDDTETNTQFGSNTTGQNLVFGDNNSTTLQILSKQVIINCERTSSGSNVECFRIDCIKWDGSSEQSYPDMFRIFNADPSGDANLPQLQMRLNDSLGSENQVLTCDANNFVKWATPTATSNWSLSSGELSVLSNSTNVNIGTSSNSGSNKLNVSGDSLFTGDTTIVGEVLMSETPTKGRTSFTTTSATTLRLQGGTSTSASSGWGSSGGEYQILTVNTPVATNGSWILFVEGVSTTHSYLGWFFGSTLQMYMTNSGSLYSRTTWTQSDNRIKTNITTEGVNQKCYDIVKRIPAKQYNYKQELINSTEDYTDKTVIGWEAQDWANDSECNYLSVVEPKPRQYYNENNELLLEVKDCLNIRKADIGSITYGAVGKLIELVEAQQAIIDKLTSASSFKAFRDSL